MIDISSLTALITALRNESQADSISPENIGAILQQIADTLQPLASEAEIASLSALRNNIESIGSFMKAITQGEDDRNNVLATIVRYNPLTGNQVPSLDQILVKQATTERAGAMRAQHVEDLYTAKKNITSILAQLTDLSNTLTQVKTATHAPLHIEVRNNTLYLSGYQELFNQGYIPYLFRLCKKQNRNRHLPDKTHHHTLKGWKLMGRENVVYIGYNGKVGFPIISHGNWHYIEEGIVEYETSPEILINPHLVGNKPVVSWGKSTISTLDYNTGKPRMLRFQFAIAFGIRKQLNKYPLLLSDLKSTMAEFSVIQTNEYWAYSQ